MSDIAIRVENLSKQYRIGLRKNRETLRERITRLASAPFRRVARALHPPAEPLANSASKNDAFFWALKDVSFEIKQGEVVGVIGRNGAGKSTLLKVLSRITDPTTGMVEIDGRVASLLEVGTGFHPELTGRENVYLNGAILGMRRAEINRKFDEIVAFAEVEQFIDTAVKHYSSGMYMRLAFAVAGHLDPEILIVDEVLAVGDMAFQKKCLGKMGDIAKGGRTIVFVSHNMAAIYSLCPHCIWLDRGLVRGQGVTSTVAQNYLNDGFHTSKADVSAQVSLPDDAAKRFQLKGIRLLNGDEQATNTFDCDEALHLELTVQVRRRTRGLYGYLVLARLDDTVVLESDSFDGGANPLDDLREGIHALRLTIPPRTLSVGNYSVYLNFSSPNADVVNVDSPGKLCRFTLVDTTSRRGNNRRGFLSTLVSWDLQAVEPVARCNEGSTP